MVAVVTNPDRPAGRKGLPTPPPVKVAALAHGLRVLQPPRVRDGSFTPELRALEPDVAVVVAYGKILPPDLLHVPRLGFVNLHFSLLPAYRGAAPVPRALLAGEETTGVSVMVLDEGMDEGPVLARRETVVDPDETAGELGTRLAAEGAPFLVECVIGYAAGTVTPVAQDHSAATYAPKLTTEDAVIDWTRPAQEIHNLVRGSNPEPGAWTMLRTERLKILRTRMTDDSGLAPGQLEVGAKALRAGTGTNALEIREGQRAGGKQMSGADLARGLRPDAGDRLGASSS